jgi:NAD(P)-dependent dehydrogenase (short-subunit alcohol dehydrogenase family)
MDHTSARKGSSGALRGRCGVPWTTRPQTTVVVSYRGLRLPVERQWRVARPGDQRRVVAGAVLFAMTNSFMTGVTLKIDGGEPLT